MSDGLPNSWYNGRTAFRQNMLGRLRLGQKHTGHVTEIMNRLCDLSDRFKRSQIEIDSDPNFSADGRRAALAQLVRNDLMPDLAQAGRPIRRALGYYASERMALSDPLKVDPTDAVAELRRQEIRSYLRGLPDAKRIAAAAELIQDDAGASAILDAAPVLSGLPSADHHKFRTAVAERVNGPRLAEIDAVERDYLECKAAADVVMNEIVAASGLTDTAFAEEMKPLEVEADA